MWNMLRLIDEAKAIGVRDLREKEFVMSHNAMQEFWIHNRSSFKLFWHKTWISTLHELVRRPDAAVMNGRQKGHRSRCGVVVSEDAYMED